MKKARGAKGPAASPRSPATPPTGAKSPAARAGSSPSSSGGAKQRPAAPPASSAIETPSRFLVAAIGLEDAPSRVLERRSTQPLAVIAAALLPRLRLRPLDPVLVIGLAHHTAVAWAWPNADHAAEPDEVRLDASVRESSRSPVGSAVRLVPVYASGIAVVPATQCCVELLALRSASPTEPMTSGELNYLRHLIAGRWLTEGELVATSLDGVLRKVRVSQLRPALDDSPRVAEQQPQQPPQQPAVVYCITDATMLLQPTSAAAPAATPSAEVRGYAAIGGLERQVEAVREIVELNLHHGERFRSYGLVPPTGILLYGPPGTGKTLIARAVAQQCRAAVVVVNGPEVVGKFYGESEQRLRDVFESALAQAPCILFIDEIDAICGRRDDMSTEMEKRVVATVLSQLDRVATGSERVVVLGATNRINALDAALRRPGRFDREIEIGVPTEREREAIFRVYLAQLEHSLTPEQIRSVAASTHGYVGADIAAVCKEAAMKALFRADIDLLFQDYHHQAPPAAVAVAVAAAGEQTPPASQLLAATVTFADMLAATAEVPPSAMREMLLDVPSVRWQDIGGQEDTKQRLKEAVEWPFQHPEAFQRMGIRPPRGVLLYGPPGCSKTMLAKALASQSGLNFIAVKGPELFSKWVGESEKAVRELFRKARAASPAIVFFDEIDALAVQRGGRGGDEGGGVADRVLSQLLHELDGIDALVNVIVVAATNRPDILDKALLRPGRLDRLLYVGLPDAAAREAIISMHLRKVPHRDDIDLTQLVSRTDGYSGAEVAAVCREASLCALEESMQAEAVGMAHFLQALLHVKPRTTATMLHFYASFQEQTRIKSRS